MFIPTKKYFAKYYTKFLQKYSKPWFMGQHTLLNLCVNAKKYFAKYYFNT